MFVRNVNDGPPAWPAHTLPLASPAPGQGVTALPGGSAPVGGGPWHREVSRPRKWQGLSGEPNHPTAVAVGTGSRGVPPVLEPTPLGPAFARRVRTKAKACDHCAALADAASENPGVTLRIEPGRGTSPRRAGSEVAVPAGCADMPPAKGAVRPGWENPLRIRERVRALKVPAPCSTRRSCASLSATLDARSVARHPGGRNPRGLCPAGRSLDYQAPEPTGWPASAGSRSRH